MRIDGLWHLCDDGIVRPVLRGEICGGDGLWIKATFLVDTGADRTVFSNDVLDGLQLPPAHGERQFAGIGGTSDAIVLDAQIRFKRDDGEKVVFSGQFAAITDTAALDMSVLGRDLTNLFALIVDRPGDVVSLIGQRHRYTIEQR